MMEAFFKTYEYTFQALGALATTAAVIVSLWLSRRESEKLKAVLSVYVIVDAGVKYDDVINIYTKNIGLKTAYVPAFCFWFKVPFRKTSYTIKPERSDSIQLVPGRSQQIQLTTVPMFQTEFLKVLEEIKFFRSLRLRFLRGYLSTESGKSYRVKFSASFKKQLAKLIADLEKNKIQNSGKAGV